MTTTFPEVHPQLQSVTEGARLCPGFGDDFDKCGDELEPGAELCGTHKREEDNFYQRKAWEADGHPEVTWYEHLTDRE